MANAREAAMVNGLCVYGVQHIREVVDFFVAMHPLHQPLSIPGRSLAIHREALMWISSDVKGQANIKRAFGDLCCRQP